MKTWDSAGDKIRRRNPEEVLASIKVEAPFNFDPGNDLSDVPDYLESIWEQIDGQADAVISLPGRDLNYSRDAVIAFYKVFHLLDCAVQLHGQGRLTWSLVESYHVSLLASRAIAAIYGVLSYTLRGRTVLVDFRPELGSVDDVKAFRKAHKDVNEPIRILCPTKLLFEQKDSWAILKRLADITQPDSAYKNTITGLAGLSKNQVSHVRNLILYDTVYWTWRSDFTAAAENEKAISKRFNSKDQHVEALLLALQSLVSCSRDLSAKLCAHIGFPFDKLPPSAGNSVKLLALS